MIRKIMAAGVVALALVGCAPDALKVQKLADTHEASIVDAKSHVEAADDALAQDLVPTTQETVARGHLKGAKIDLGSAVTSGAKLGAVAVKATQKVEVYDNSWLGGKGKKVLIVLSILAVLVVGLGVASRFTSLGGLFAVVPVLGSILYKIGLISTDVFNKALADVEVIVDKVKDKIDPSPPTPAN